MDVNLISLLVGLGNPGDKYARNRHNVGFMLIDKLLARWRTGNFEERHTAESFCYPGRFRGRAVLLQKPLTFMNLSGAAVEKIVRKTGLTAENLLLIHDDMDLPLGELRIRKKGTSGGHNGVESVIGKLGGNFARLRIGVGRPKHGEENPADYVLEDFDVVEKELLERTLERAAEAVECILTRGIAPAMNEFNKNIDSEKSETVSNK